MNKKIPDSFSYLTSPQVRAVGNVCRDLLQYASSGLLPKNYFSKLEEVKKSLGGDLNLLDLEKLQSRLYESGFKRAQELHHNDPFVYLRIGFSPSGEGFIQAQQPIIPGITPMLESEYSPTKTSQERMLGMLTKGKGEAALYPIENGYTHKKMNEAGFYHSPVLTYDRPLHDFNPSGDKIRYSEISLSPQSHLHAV